MEFAEGNIYLDEQPICDDQWGIEEAKVACRCVFSCSLVKPKYCPWTSNLFVMTNGGLRKLKLLVGGLKLFSC